MKDYSEIKPLKATDMMEVRHILDRAEQLNLLAKDRITLLMDLEVANNQYPLRFTAMLNSSNFDFSHDIVGIQNNINRKTYQLDNCFVPRFATCDSKADSIIAQYDLEDDNDFMRCFNDLKDAYAMEHNWYDENGYWAENDKWLYDAECYAYNKIEEYKQELNKDTVEKEDIDI